MAVVIGVDLCLGSGLVSSTFDVVGFNAQGAVSISENVLVFLGFTQSTAVGINVTGLALVGEGELRLVDVLGLAIPAFDIDEDGLAETCLLYTSDAADDTR